VTCDSTGTYGCAIYRVTPEALQWNWRALDGKVVRIQGMVVAKCQDQTLYFSRLDADSVRREQGLSIWGDMRQFATVWDSVASVEVEGVLYHGPSGSPTKRFAGILQDIRLRNVYSVSSSDTTPAH